MKRLFIVLIKYIPIIQMVGMLFNNILYCFSDIYIISYILDFIIGNSITTTFLLYVCSYVFGFCKWHRFIITANIINLLIANLDAYYRIPISDIQLLIVYHFIAAIFICISTYEIGELRTELAVLKATRPYQDALIQCDIRRVAEHADFNLWRRTCRMISGEVVLPNTPVIEGYASYNPCHIQSTTPAPAA